MLTNEYPTAEVGEAFISNELPYIGEPFSEVIFAPRFSSTAEPVDLDSVGAGVPVRVLTPPSLTRGDLLRAAARSTLSPAVVRAALLTSPQVTSCSGYQTVISAAKRVIALEARIDSLVEPLRRALEGRPAVFYSFWFHSAAYVAQGLAKRFDGHAVTRAHRYDIYASSTWDSAWHHSSIDGLSAVFSCSADGRAYLQSRLPGSAHKIEVAHLGTPDLGVQHVPRVAGEFHLLTVSRVAAAKRLDRVVSALRMGDVRPVGIRWTHFGGTPDGADDRTFEENVREVLPPHVVFDFRGNVPNREVLAHYRRHRVDLFANVSESEGIPVSVMEALSFGVPVAATPVGGTPELVRDGKNGYLLTRDDVPRSLATVIQHLATMAEPEIKDLRLRARKSWERSFDAARNYPLFFQRVLDPEAR